MRNKDIDLNLIKEKWECIAKSYYDIFKNGNQDRSLTGLTAFLKEEINTINPEKILDIGCGPGHLSKWISDEIKVSKVIVGLDISERMIELSAKENKSNKTHYFAMPAERLVQTKFIKEEENIVIKKSDSDGIKFDLVVANLTLMDLNNIGIVMKGIGNQLTNNGILIMTITNPMMGYMKTEHYKEEPIEEHSKLTYADEYWKKGIFETGGVELPFIYIKHRPFSEYISALIDNGLCVLRIIDNFVLPKEFPPIYLYIEARRKKCTLE